MKVFSLITEFWLILSRIYYSLREGQSLSGRESLEKEKQSHESTTMSERSELTKTTTERL